jgi:hypothetical protein
VPTAAFSRIAFAIATLILKERRAMKVLEISKKKPSKWTPIDWDAMGRHHAQALFARWCNHKDYRGYIMRNQMVDQKTLYLECVHEAAEHELKRVEGAEKDYWRAFIITLNLCVLTYEYDPFSGGPFVVCVNGQTVRDPKTQEMLQFYRVRPVA